MRISDYNYARLCGFKDERYAATCGFVIVITRDYADLRMNNIQQYADLQLQLYQNIQIYKWQNAAAYVLVTYKHTAIHGERNAFYATLCGITSKRARANTQHENEKELDIT